MWKHRNDCKTINAIKIKKIPQTSTGQYRSCAALASFSGTFDLILFEAVNFGFIVEKYWLNNYLICLFFCGISKPNQTKLNQTNQSKPKTTYFVSLFEPSIQTNQTFSEINLKLTASNKIKSKVPKKLVRAAQLLYRTVLVFSIFMKAQAREHLISAAG